jgi:hypothetical protein
MHNKKAESIYHGLDKKFIELTLDEKNESPTSGKKLFSLVELLANFKDDEIQDQLAKVRLCNDEEKTLFVKLNS